MQQRWINDDVYIYERRLGGNVVLVAINKSKTSDPAISGLLLLSRRTYADYLNGTMGGVGLTVSGTAGDNNAADNSRYHMAACPYGWPRARRDLRLGASRRE